MTVGGTVCQWHATSGLRWYWSPARSSSAMTHLYSRGDAQVFAVVVVRSADAGVGDESYQRKAYNLDGAARRTCMSSAISVSPLLALLLVNVFFAPRTLSSMIGGLGMPTCMP